MCLINLTSAQTLYIYKLSNVIMVNKNKNLVFAALQVVLSDFEWFNNSQKFTNVSFVSSFS